MKRCPTCEKTYTDETLKFCRLDGTPLVFFSSDSPTLVFGSGEAAGTETGRIAARGRRSPKSKAIDSIAVLPFENLSHDSNTEYLSDGITETIINNLSQSPKLKVMARSTVFSYKGQQIDSRKVGNELEVRAVVTGRVQLLGDHLTIAIELVDVADGSQLWGERYSRKMTDIFALQEEISEQISAKLRLKLTSSLKKRLSRLHTKNSEAYQLYLMGRYFWNKRTEEDANKGIEYFHRALSFDPNFALAFCGLADCQTLLGDVGIQAMLPKEAFLQGEQSATRALQIDDALAEAHGTMGHISMHLFDWPRAGSELQRAVELNPNYAQAYVWYAYYLAFTGHCADSLAAIDRSLKLDPLSLPVNKSAAELLYFAGRFDESIDQFHKSMELDPDKPQAHLELGRVYENRKMFEAAITELTKGRELSHDSPESLASLAHCYAVSGATSEAKALLRDLTQLSEHRYVSPYDLALLHSGLGQKQEAFEWLDRAYEMHDGWMIYVTVDPRWRPVREDARFADIVRRVGLAT